MARSQSGRPQRDAAHADERRTAEPSSTSDVLLYFLAMCAAEALSTVAQR
jgi:hypothetical protein